MNSTPPTSSNKTTPAIDAAIRDVAAAWVVRQDRGLSAKEDAEFKAWLKADPRHAAAVARSSLAWSILDDIPQHETAPRTTNSVQRNRWLVVGSLAVAAALVLGLVKPWSRSVPVAANSNLVLAARIAEPRNAILPDGTNVLLNEGSEIIEQFTPAERRVLLVRGEAHFAVTHNPSRPFVVRAANVEVHAVGTAFDVNLQSAAVNVLVTEGKVRVGSSSDANTTTDTSLTEQSMVKAGQRAVVPLDFAPGSLRVNVSDIGQDEQARILGWQNTWVQLGGATLGEVAAEFEHRTGHRLVLSDPTLAGLRIGGRFRADNVERFVRVLVDNYGLVAEQRGAHETLLRRK